MGFGGRDKDEDAEKSARHAALFDPDSVFHDHADQARAGSDGEAQKSSDDKPTAPEPPKSGNLYARSERRRTGALTKEMIKQMADRAERATKKKE